MWTLARTLNTFPVPHCPGCHVSRITCHVSRVLLRRLGHCKYLSRVPDTSWHKLTQADTGTAATTAGKLQQQQQHRDTTLDKLWYAAYICSQGTRNRAAAVMFENVGRLDDGDNHWVALHYTEYSRANTRHTATQHSLCLLPAQSSPDWITAMDLIL